MCQSYEWILTIISLGGLIQSLVWTSLGISGALVYLCAIHIPPYSDPSDFFRVTFVKLYLEGPRCIPDGSYLGKFNDDYKDPDKFQRLLTQDLMFAVMIAYIFLNITYFIQSLLFYKNRKVQTAADVSKLLSIIQGWSTTTLIISFMDAFLTVDLIQDFLSLMKYNNNCQERTEVCGRMAEVTYIPVFFAVVACRFVALWLWNVIVGVIFFINSFCSNKVVKLPPIKENKLEIKQVKEEVEKKELPRNKEELLPKAEFPKHYYPDWEPRGPNPTTVRKSYSLEGITDFREKRHPREVNQNRETFTDFRERCYSQEDVDQKRETFTDFRKRCHAQEDVDQKREAFYGQREAFSYPKHFRWQEDWGMLNDGYVDEGQGPMELEEPSDFNHNLKNFEQGHKRIKIVKPPLGKPVSIPVPPPLPQNDAYNC